ncbi:amidase signature enzyme [Coniophora puteana RWD-64-598 SS2]|uniref:Amidase signature enzyme n=1 Tax=Coniophora puteana (strain RWD-64-598) TaxID=741705 RepID=A0A5M3MRB5_CONPW|nr:amidase signature enzyme [Coniophora puteana RWD-64-598 SS2]EIW81709.1 amidase signature enzyme [Coniophora puteana RWD-64-598 SS2]
MDKHGLPDLYDASIAELQKGMVEGLFTSVDLVRTYLARIDEVNHKGPQLRAVIETNPRALEQAAALDERRKTRGPLGPLHGIPLLLKDNIATAHEDGMQTTAGSHALVGSIVPRASHVVSLLTQAGAINLGKANLSEFGNFRGKVSQGFSGRGGQTLCPYEPNAKGCPGGSSSGSAVSVAVGLAAGALGTETDGSILSPASRNCVVGLKTTVGLISRAGVIPISSTQDVIGPICRSVADVAIILSTIAGPDPRDEVTRSQPSSIPDYVAALRADAVKGVHVGIPRKLIDPNERPGMNQAFEVALGVLRQLGAVIVEDANLPSTEEIRLFPEAERTVMTCDLKADLNKYLSELVEVPTGVRSLADLIEWNKAHPELELVSPHFEDQYRFIQAEETSRDDAYYAAREIARELGRERGIDAALKKYGVDVFVLPKNGASSRAAALAGYPAITVPMGYMPDDTQHVSYPPSPLYDEWPGCPFGLVFFGAAYSEAKLLGCAYAFEQATRVRGQKRPCEWAVPKTQLADVVAKKA